METEAKKPARKKRTTGKSSTAKPRTKKPAAKTPLKASPDDIKKMAYQIYLARQENGIAGNEASDWLIADYLVTRHPVL